MAQYQNLFTTVQAVGPAHVGVPLGHGNSPRRGAKRWTMTERSRAALTRSASALAIGPSALAWNGRWLEIEIDEIANPLPRRVKGRVRVHPPGLSRFNVALDAAGRHR